MLAYLEEDYGEEQVETVSGSAALLLRDGFARPAIGKHHSSLSLSLLLLRDGRKGREAGGGEWVEGEDFGAGAPRSPGEGPRCPQSEGHLLSPLLNGLVFLFDAYDGTQRGEA